MSDPLWTPEDIELVAMALQDAPWPCEHGNIQGDRHTCSACLATAILAALAETGRLAPRCTEEEPCKQCNVLLRDLGYGPYDEPEEVRLAVHGVPWLPVSVTTTGESS
jgi:hypothetical protein